MDGLICGQCQKHPPAFNQVIAPWTYSFPIDTLVSRFKHQARWPLGHMLARLLGQHLQHRFDNAELNRPDYLLPVPMARKRLRQRGFNQAQMVARWLSSALDIPLNEHALLRRLKPWRSKTSTPRRVSVTCSTPLPWRPALKSQGNTWRWWTMYSPPALPPTAWRGY